MDAEQSVKCVGGDIDPATDLSAELRADWEAWLEANFDPGNYNSYKKKDKAYPEGQQWQCDVYMPAHLMERLRAEQAANSGGPANG